MGNAEGAEDIESFLSYRLTEKLRLEQITKRLLCLQQQLAHDGLPDELKNAFNLRFFDEYSAQEPLVKKSAEVLPDWIRQRHTDYGAWSKEYPPGEKYTPTTPLNERSWWSPFDFAWDLVNPLPGSSGEQPVRHLDSTDKLAGFMETNGSRLLEEVCRQYGAPWPPPEPPEDDLQPVPSVPLASGAPPSPVQSAVAATELDWLREYRAYTLRELERATDLSRSSLSDKWQHLKHEGKPICREEHGVYYWLRVWVNAHLKA